jgi:hypothetical protein
MNDLFKWILFVLGLSILFLRKPLVGKIRLYVIGSQTFGQAVDNSVAMTAVGFATVLCAKVGQVVFSLSLATITNMVWRCALICMKQAL